MTSIFSTHALKYFESGIPVIPLGGKIPLVHGWQVWSERAQTEEELEVLIEKYPRANIGAVMGLWATAVDIDTDDERVLRTVPYSPIQRRGRKGFIYVYAANPNLKNIPGVQYPVELLNVGRQIVLPPSVHPETGEPYVWSGHEDIFTFHDLPMITESGFRNIEHACKKYGIMRAPRTYTEGGGDLVHLSDIGRNNYLTRVAYAMACEGNDAEEIAERLIYLDDNEHEQSWFKDPTEPHKGKNPKAVAFRMAARAIKKSEARGERSLSQVLTVDLKSAVPNLDLAIPRPRGLIRLFQDYCNLVSNGNQDALGLGGGLALMAAVASNRFRTKAGAYDVWPNLYIMNLAPSGFGKETSQRALDDVLMNTGLLGSATYKSGSSIIMNLPEQQARLDVIDECAMLLKAMAAKEDYKADIVDVLSSLYSKSNSYFHGFTSRGDGKNFGACWNPCVNILGSTTPAGFKSSVSRDMAAKGLLPRFLIFWQRDVGEFKRKIDVEASEKVLSEIRRLVNLLMAVELRDHPESGQVNLLSGDGEEPKKRYDPEFVPMTDGAQKALVDIQEVYFNEGKRDPDGFESAFKNRFSQHVGKLAMLDALGLGLGEVGLDSVEWAHSVVKWQWETVKELYELASAENDHDKDVKRVMQYIKQRGNVKRIEVTRKFPGIYGKRLDGIISQLDTSDMITISASEPGKKGPKAQILSFKEH